MAMGDFAFALLLASASGWRNSRRPVSEHGGSQAGALAEVPSNTSNIDELVIAYKALALSLNKSEYENIDTLLKQIADLNGESVLDESDHIRPAVFCELGCGGCVGGAYLMCAAPPYAGDCAFSVVACAGACANCPNVLCTLMPVLSMCATPLIGAIIGEKTCQMCQDWWDR